MIDPCDLTCKLFVPFQDRVILGTDYPFPLGEVLIADAYPGKVIKESSFSTDIKVSVMQILML